MKTLNQLQKLIEEINARNLFGRNKKIKKWLIHRVREIEKKAFLHGHSEGREGEKFGEIAWQEYKKNMDKSKIFNTPQIIPLVESKKEFFKNFINLKLFSRKVVK